MSQRRVDLGTVVQTWHARTGLPFDGVVVELVPPQQFPLTWTRGNRCLDYRTRYVVRHERGAVIRSADQMEIIAL